MTPASQPNEPTSEIVRFGPFEADLRAGELRKRGFKLRLQELPFRLLVSLLERPGEVVTREELQAKLWPGGTFVDFEQGLGTALNKVREALGDSAATPRFIETIPRRGYRFIAEVQKPEVERAGPPLTEVAAPQVRRTRNYPVAAFIAGALVIVLASGTAYSRFRNQPVPITDADVLVLADFTNTTGDAAFDGALRQALAFELEQSPFLKIMDDEEVNQTLQLMGRPAGQRITNDIAHEVCVREGQKATIAGSIASLGKTYQIALQATNCQTGATLAREQAEAEDKEHVLKAVAKSATGMRAKLGESLSSIQKLDRSPNEAVTTTSLDALKAFHLGYDLALQDSPREAIPQLQRAIQMDPNFAHAYEMLGIEYGNLGDPARHVQYLSKAFALKDHASERERLYISGRYYQFVTREMNKAFDAYQVDARTYPRWSPPHSGLFTVYSAKGEYEKALEEEQEALRLAPRSVIFVGSVMGLYQNLDRFDEAKEVAEKAFSRKLDGPPVHRELLLIAYIQDDHAAREKEIKWLAGKPDEYRALLYQAYNAITYGQRRAAKDFNLRAAEVARRQGLMDLQLGFPPAVIDALMGDCEAARKGKSNLALVYCGDASALRLAEEEAAKNPPPNPDIAPLLYQRGLAWLRTGKGAEAAAEFQKILDHKGRNWGPFYSLAYLGLARASSLAADTAKAKRAYQDFLSLWKDADKDLPLLSQANKELAALR